jgi:hypothetical protein
MRTTCIAHTPVCGTYRGDPINQWYVCIDEIYVGDAPTFRTLGYDLQVIHEKRGELCSVPITPDEMIDVGMAFLRAGIEKARGGHG